MGPADFSQVIGEINVAINPEKFELEIRIGETVDPGKELIPPLLIQPFVENAIRHGLLPSSRKGLLKLSFFKTETTLVIEIFDNGIGMERSGQILRQSPLRYVSRGTQLTLNRIRLLNQLGFRIEVATESNHQSTTVILKLHK